MIQNLLQQQLDTLPPLRELVKEHDLGAKKSLGQNYLFDLNLTRRIARSVAPFDNYTTIEVGPGPGGLTRALFYEGASHVIALEKDPRFIRALQPLANLTQLQLIETDALQTDLSTLTSNPIKIAANLPYNIATPLLINWLKLGSRITSMTLMFQREVVDRILAKPRTKDYGRLSILAQWLCHTKKLFDIPPTAFVPPPKIWSSVVQLEPKTDVDLSLFSTVEKLTAAAFGQRRKMLRSSLKSIVDDPATLLESQNIAPTARAEELTVQQFIQLAKSLISAS